MEISHEIIELCHSALEQELKNTRIAIKVKLSDLRHNMDLSRISSPTEKDYARLERYKSEYMTLIDFLN